MTRFEPARTGEGRDDRGPDPEPEESEVETLAIDIGGTGIKMLPLDARGRPLTARARELTPEHPTPDAVLEVIRRMLGKQRPFDRVSVGFPGVVALGIVRTAPNLGTKLWRGYDLQGELRSQVGKPVRVINDADMQGYGVIAGEGVELVLTLGTGLGSALFIDGRLAPNLELGHHPFEKGKTYEERVCDSERRRIGNKRWRKRVARIFEPLARTFNYDALHLGGGNTKKLTGPLADKVRRFDNVEGLTGGMRLWLAPDGGSS